MPNYTLEGHRCEKVAEYRPCGEGRRMWVGKLTEPYKDYPETHCLHVETPEKTVVFGVNATDACAMAVLAQVIHKDTYDDPIAQNWTDRMERACRSRVQKDNQEE